MASLDMTHWVSQLPLEFTSKPLVNLIIPGSHDSFTATLDKDGPLGNDRPEWLKYIEWLPGFKGVIYRKGVTQHLFMTEQLEHGVRYFDFRLSRPSEDPSTVKVLHGIYGSEVGPILADIVAYLEHHPHEVVLLDFNHFYNFDDDTHRKVVSALKEMFGPKLCPAQRPRDISLDQMWKNGYQVIAFYIEEKFVHENPFLWPNADMQSPWANADSPKKLIAYLQDQLMKRPMGDNDVTFFNTQGILTPSPMDVVLHFYTSLEDYMSTPTTQRIVYWIRDFLPFLKPRFNVIFAHFVEKFDICRNVVQLNFRTRRKILVNPGLEKWFLIYFNMK